MLGFKEWKMLNENMSFNLGLARTPTVGGVVGGTGASEWALEEAKKKMKKKMMDDEEMDSSDDDMGDDDDDDDDDDAGMASKKDIFKKKLSKPNMGGGDDDDDDDDDDDMDDDDDDDMGGEVKDTPMFMKKKMKGKGKDKKKMGKACGEKMSKGCGKKMKNEEIEAEFWASLKSQMGSDLNQKNWDGISMQEDSLLPPQNANAGLEDGEPGPGEVGYAPQQRFGSFGGSWTM